MPDLNEFFKKDEPLKPYELEKIPGLKPCGKCNEDVNGAFWDPIELVMSWRCSKGHENIVKVQ